MGNATLVDSANIYVENTVFVNASVSTLNSAGSVLTITGSATGTYTGSDFSNNTNNGGRFCINFVSIVATCTCRFLVQAKDQLSSLYLTITSLSLEVGTASVGTAGTMWITIYPGLSVTATAGQSLSSNVNDIFSRVMRVVCSITATASVGGAAVTAQVGLNRLM